MYLFPIFITFISFFFSFFFGRLINNLYAGILTSLSVFSGFIVSLFIFYEVAICQSAVLINCCPWIITGLLEISWTFYYDSLTATMLIVILCISACAHIYSIEYMLSDPHQIKFMSYLSLFTFFMLLLVTSSNFIILFMGWEGVGICSYLLINFWHTRVGANKSAIMAMFVNKIGDISLLLSFTLIYFLINTFDFSIFFLSLSSTMNGVHIFDIFSRLVNTTLVAALNTNSIFVLDDVLFLLCLIGIFFIIGAVGKSAQIGLHTWLPEATEGPTPVSSLIHAATMVTAGIFLIIRTNALFQMVGNLFIVIIALGSITAFVGSTIGIFQADIKKIIAYSTCSQLGYMFLACGLSGYEFSIYHLVNHAFFKALLLLVAGYIIHAINNEQDIRKMGGLLSILPFAYIGLTIGSLSLLGFPFFSGFFSKEKIIELFYSFYNYNILNVYSMNVLIFFQMLANIAVTFTVLYSIKVLVYVFFYSYQNNKKTLFNLHYSSFVTVVPLFFLSILSIGSGYLLEDMMVGFSTDLWDASIYKILNGYYMNNINYFEFNYLSSKLPVYSILYFMVLFILLFYVIGNGSLLFYLKLMSKWTDVFYTFFNKKYIVLNKNIYYPIIDFFFRFSYDSMYKFFDKGVIEIIGPFGIVNSLNKAVVNNTKMQTGMVYHYFGLMVLSVLLFILLVIFYGN
jgi:NADH-ubiquinone oxidoreductase chain 5